MTIQGVTSEKTRSTYLIDVILPNDVEINDLKVCDSEIHKQEIDLLIGMDIISKGDFAVSSVGGKTSFTFRVPSVKRADYQLEAKIFNLTGSHGRGKKK